MVHAFPDRDLKSLKKIAITSCSRTVELGLLAITLPYFSRKKLQKNFKVDASLKNFFAQLQPDKRPRIILLPHFSQMEAMTTLPLVGHIEHPENVGVIFRPLRNRSLNEWITKTREKFGLKLLPRDQGFFSAKQFLENNNTLVILFDQNAGQAGILSTFFGRIASSSPLPDFFQKNFDCEVFMLFPKRTGFFRAVCSIETLPFNSRENFPVTIAMNHWLEKKLSQNDSVCEDWLWMHNRWHVKSNSNDWLNLSQKKSLLDQRPLPQKTKIFIRLPYWLGDIVMSIPFLRAIRKSRPDAEITLFCKSHFIEFLKFLKLADRFAPLPPKNIFYPFYFWKYRKEFVDFYVLLINSVRGDIEAKMINAQESFGMLLEPNRKNFLLKRAFYVPLEKHQTLQQESFLRQMGFQSRLDLSPIDLSSSHEKNTSIGLLCGSEHNPEKRWPVEHWQKLIVLLLEKTPYSITLFGTKKDYPIIQEIKAKFKNQARIQDKAGKTTILDLCHLLSKSVLNIGNDSGGTHLSNMLGIPTIAIFGPTDPNYSRPIFEASTKVITAKNGSISNVVPEEISSAALEILRKSI